jgi:hypothetical protein
MRSEAEHDWAALADDEAQSGERLLGRKAAWLSEKVAMISLAVAVSRI